MTVHQVGSTSEEKEKTQKSQKTYSHLHLRTSS